MTDNPGLSGRGGIWIALFGPDGAGKSAAIEDLARRMEANFSGVMQFHFRPRFRGAAVARPPVTAPHAQTPRGTLLSAIKLIYWLLDCWSGYLATILRGLRRSRLVIFDRYYPDILVDPLRYRLPQSVLALARRLVLLAPHPQLCVLLDVPAEIVQQRKQEVSQAESLRQRAAYLQLFRSQENTLLVDAGRPVTEVVEQIIHGLTAMLPSAAVGKNESESAYASLT